jgi:pimeloyl-ACP methyl ester carboxylesterase
MIFDVIDRGPADDEPAVLLHGFPQFNTAWDAVMDRLVAQGFRCIAPNQRGYAPRARPLRRRDYRVSELVGDVVALLDEIGAPKVHLVGHDWGAMVAWGVAAAVPERLATLTTMSAPHPSAFVKAILTSRQGLASWYMYAFQVPKLPELVLARKGGAGGAAVLQRVADQSKEAATRDIREMVDTGALTGAINWYRGLVFTKPASLRGRVSVPTMFVWSDGDTACLEPGARDCARFVTGEYRFEILQSVSHWMLDDVPDQVANLLLGWLSSHRIATGGPNAH